MQPGAGSRASEAHLHHWVLPSPATSRPCLAPPLRTPPRLVRLLDPLLPAPATQMMCHRRQMMCHRRQADRQASGQAVKQNTSALSQAPDPRVRAVFCGAYKSLKSVRIKSMTRGHRTALALCSESSLHPLHSSNLLRLRPVEYPPKLRRRHVTSRDSTHLQHYHQSHMMPPTYSTTINHT